MNMENTNNTPQIPAVGIMKTSDFGDAKFYKIACTCGNTDDDIAVEVEADEHGVTTHVWTKVKTDWWSDRWQKRYDYDNEFLQDIHWHWIGFLNGLWNRLKITWKIWTTGYLEYESWTILNKQQTLNLSEVLKQSVQDVETFYDAAVSSRKSKNGEQ